MDVELPRLADTLVEGTVTRWLKRPGEVVQKGEPLVEIDTDKVTSELEAPASGVLSEVLTAEGETVPVGTVIARIGTTVPSEPKPPPASAPRPRERLQEHIRRSAAAIPEGVCAREIPSAAADRLDQAVAASAGPVRIALSPPSPSRLVIPALEEGQEALLAVGADTGGRLLLTLCYDRRVLDDWAADRLLKRIADEAS